MFMGWFRHYNLAKIYYKENGNLLIPMKYETKDEQGKVVKLGIWIVTQRQAYKNNKLEDWKIKLLEEIKMTWVVENIKELCKKASDKTWLKKYNIAKEKYGNLLIPSTYVVRDKNGEIFNLSYWVKKQRNPYKNNELEDWKMKLLEQIKIVCMSDNWFKNYNIAKEYYEKYGNLLISSTYVVRDKNGEIFKLSYWVKNQRNLYKNNELENWKMKLLEQIKIVESEKSEKHKKSNINVINNDTWMKYYFMLHMAIFLFQKTRVVMTYIIG